MDYTTSQCNFTGEVNTTPKPDKGVIEHATTFPLDSGAFDRCQLVRLDKPDTGLQSWRMRIPSKLEVRITESPTRAIQATRARESKCHYVVLRGWVACVTGSVDAMKIQMAFAKSNDFVLSVEPHINYVVVTSTGSAFSFQETTFTTSSPVKDALYEAVTQMSDDSIQKMSSIQNEISEEEITKLIHASFL